MAKELDGTGQKGKHGIEATMIQIEEATGIILETAERGKGKSWFKRKVSVLNARVTALINKDPNGETTELVARIKK